MDGEFARNHSRVIEHTGGPVAMLDAQGHVYLTSSEIFSFTIHEKRRFFCKFCVVLCRILFSFISPVLRSHAVLVEEALR